MDFKKCESFGSNNKTFKDNIELLKLSKQDKMIRDEVIVNNQGLILNLLFKKYSYYKDDLEDLFMIGVCGLIKAVDTFDLDKGYNFSTYASTCINNEIIRFFRSKKNNIETDSLDDNILNCFDDDDNLRIQDTLQDISVNVEQEVIDKDLYERVNASVNKLNGLDKEIIKNYFGFDYQDPISFAEIGKRNNLSKQSIHVKYNKVLNRLKKELTKSDNKIKIKSKYIKRP